MNLINDVRREFKSPPLAGRDWRADRPLGRGTGTWGTLRKAQAQAAARPEFQGTVKFVETHDFVRPANESPNTTHGFTNTAMPKPIFSSAMHSARG